MLGSIRKFSTSIYAKILLGIVIVPFVFWGMGGTFGQGNKNVILTIDKEKYSTQDFNNFINKNRKNEQKITSNEVDELLSIFIVNKLMEKELEHFQINLSDKSLSKLIKVQENFQKNNSFSRIEYEKFLIKNNMSAVNFENNLLLHERKKQLLYLVGGGVKPPHFLINKAFNKINQKRKIQLINLKDIFKNKLNISNEEIKTFYEKNKDNFKENYKSVKILELKPDVFTGDNEFDDIFFKKIDEIDDMIISGSNFENIRAKFNLKKVNNIIINSFGDDLNGKKIDSLSQKIVKNIFSIGDEEPTKLVDVDNKYFIVEVVKNETFYKSIENVKIREKIKLNLKHIKKRKLISEIASKLGNNTFLKSDFDNFSNEKKISIRHITIKNANDKSVLEQDVVTKIYSAPSKRVILVHDVSFSKNYLIYIDNIKYFLIKKESEEYNEYSELSKAELKNIIFDTYDIYIKEKYKIEINYDTLKTMKNYYS
jgi:peptidyl-prolyl cis-trans isomerase D